MDDITRWKPNGLPRKGWRLAAVVDEENIDTQCQWCGTYIRYVHILVHDESQQETACGCICAESLTGDYASHKAKENQLKNYMSKSMRWCDSPKWKLSKNGNIYRQKPLVIIRQKTYGEYYLSIGLKWVQRSFRTSKSAKEYAFNIIYENE